MMAKVSYHLGLISSQERIEHTVTFCPDLSDKNSADFNVPVYEIVLQCVEFQQW